MNKTDAEVIAAIDKARPGISKYLALMDRLYSVDVSRDEDFQRMYNDFYKMRQRQADWYSFYYDLLERSKNSRPSFKTILELFYKRFNRCETSFSSKFVATLDPWKPVWDKYVIENVNPNPDGGPNTRLDIALAKYARLQKWYSEFHQSGERKEMGFSIQ
ncbi:hypothetical protein [Candidatus Methylobacter favarea]|uniref:hypothetical protein n=1 Tax=Candidatus Methylobacter favarea TaxID=2707345 RepID=UPI00157CDBA7|nr:hypothetical protein [Candidatus Methylobacter favarea]